MSLGPLFPRRIVPAADGHTWPHVVIVGGGFAGANAVMRLKDERVRVTLIDRNVYKTFQPLLYQVATAGLNSGDVTMFLRGLSLKARNMRFRQGEVTGVDPQRKQITVDQGEPRPQVISYDYLLLANGTTPTFFGTSGAEEHAMPMYNREQALAIRERIFSELERASAIVDSFAPDSLHVSIVGGGPTGVEIAGALADFRMQELDILYPEMSQDTLQIKVVQRGKELLKTFDEELRQYTAKELEDRGVELRLGKGVKNVGYDYIELEDGEILESDITIWAAGVAIDRTVGSWGVPQDKRGRILVEPTLQVQGHPEILAAGDIAGGSKEDGSDAIEQLAQPAIQTGRAAGETIAALVRGEHPKPFSYTNLGTMATIGRHAAIAQIPGFGNLKGSIGWFSWLGVHISKLLGARNRRAVTMNLISLYAGMAANHQPNPIVGEVSAKGAARAFLANKHERRFGYKAEAGRRRAEDSAAGRAEGSAAGRAEGSAGARAEGSAGARAEGSAAEGR